MPRPKRFLIDHLDLHSLPVETVLPPAEAHHARVLRLAVGSPIEVSDREGTLARGVIVGMDAQSVRVRLKEQVEMTIARTRPRFRIATAWPKGKRASVMVEKCAELGAFEIVPIRYERSVVSKDDESEGLVRLRRIAAEASKQCRRPDILTIAAEKTLTEYLSLQRSGDVSVVLHPSAKLSWAELLADSLFAAAESITVFVGPEGGLSPVELDLVQQHGIKTARLATHVLRIETAAICACAVMDAFLLKSSSERS